MEATQDLSKLLTTAQAARELGCSGENVRRLVREGRLPAQQTPLGALIDPHDLERLRLQRAGAPADEDGNVGSGA